MDDEDDVTDQESMFTAQHSLGTVSTVDLPSPVLSSREQRREQRARQTRAVGCGTGLKSEQMMLAMSGFFVWSLTAHRKRDGP